MRAEPETLVEILRVAGEKIDAAPLEVRMGENAFNHPFAESAPPVHLVTMGCPLLMLAWAYPKIFASDRPEGKSWRFPAVRTWRNFFRTADTVGRRLGVRARLAGDETTVADECLGNGGHAGYFASVDLVERLIKGASADDQERSAAE